MTCVGGKEHAGGRRPRALFLLKDGTFLGDDQICSGNYPTRLQGEACPFSVDGRMPSPVRIDEVAQHRAPGLGEEGDWAPPCCLEHLGPLKGWRQARRFSIPKAFEGLRLFKCRQMFFLVVPGLMDPSARSSHRGRS